jgi:acyl dehydratase
MTPARTSSPPFTSIAVGDALPALEVPMTATLIAAGAIATRDFMPVHHDRDFAMAQGAPDIFMNILSDTGYCSRFLTDWAGPDARVARLSIRLGVPVFPGDRLVYAGEVSAVTPEGDEGVVEVTFRATTALGDHVTGTAALTLPLEG